jgi:hypothetical protein
MPDSTPISASPIAQPTPNPRVKAICNKCGFIGICEDDRGGKPMPVRFGYPGSSDILTRKPAAKALSRAGGKP